MRDQTDWDTLPREASEASRLRHRVALDLIGPCPHKLGQEIALTGSASRGVAADDSDIELNFWVPRMPAPPERGRWLRTSGNARWLSEAGATEIVLDTNPLDDGSVWATFRVRGIWIEAGWQSISTHEKLLRSILAGSVLDHWRLIMAEIITHSVPLRSSGRLKLWKQWLSVYPERVQSRLIEDATELWTLPRFFEGRWVAIRRGNGFRQSST